MVGWRMWRHDERGYVALITVLIVGAAATAVAITLLSLGADSQRSATVNQQAKQARSLAIACGEEASQVVHDSNYYNGTNSLSLGQGNCSYNIYNTTNTTKTILVTGTVGNVVKKLQATVTIGGSNITIGSWKEVNAVAVPTPAFVQAKMNSSVSLVSSIGATVNAVQGAGNLNVVVVGWDASTGNISSVSDTAGNLYTLATRVNRGTNLTQAIFYAKNIVAAQPNITAFFTATVQSPDIRIAEYSGIDTLDPVESALWATGSGTNSAIGNFTTTVPEVLIVAGGQTAGTYSAAGSGFTSRGISTNGNIIEDRVVSTIGTYSANATTSSANWVFEAVAFKASGQ